MVNIKGKGWKESKDGKKVGIERERWKDRVVKDRKIGGKRKWRENVWK